MGCCQSTDYKRREVNAMDRRVVVEDSQVQTIEMSKGSNSLSR